MNCKKCGSDNNTDAIFCEKCGSDLIMTGAVPFFQQEENVKPIFKPFDPSAVTDASTANDASETSVPSYNNSSVAGLRALPKDNTATSHKAFWITLTSIVIFFALVGGLGFAFRIQILKSVAPERYMQMSLVKTFAVAQSETDDILGLSKFTDKAASYDFSFEADEASAEGSWKYDSANEKALMDLSIAVDGEEYENNQLYISPDLIAFSVPDLITDTDYLTIDPATFVDEWAAKGWAEDMPMKNLEEYIHTIFGKNENAGSDNQLNTLLTDLFLQLSESAVFSSDGIVEEKISGENYKMDQMTYTFSEDDVNDFYQELISQMEEAAAANEDLMMAGTSSLAGTDTDYVFDALADLEINGDVAVHFFIDQNGNVRKTSVEEFEITYEESDIEIGMEIEFGDVDKPTDDMSALITIEADGDTAEITLDCESSYEEGVYTSSIDLAMGSDDEPGVMSISYDVEWDKENTSGENLDSEIKIKFDGSSMTMTLAGTLTTDDKSTKLSNAVFEMVDEYGETTTVDLSYGVTLIDPSEIRVNTSDSIPLMKYKPFLDSMNMGSGLSM